ncbi:MAG: N-acetylmuramoyl-L-alanine amidase [Nitrospirota bacterium]
MKIPGAGTACARDRAAAALRSVFYGLWVLASLLLVPAAGADTIVDVKGVRHWSTADYTRIVIDLSAPVEFTRGSLSDPERLFFDLKNARVAREMQKSFAADSPIIKSVRIGQFNADTARIVFDLEVSTYDYKVIHLEDPPRLVIDISSKTAPEKKPDAKQELRPELLEQKRPGGKPESKPEARPERKPDPNTEARFMKRRIVVDPGHGGHDPGAVGPSGLYEKDVVLDIALKVRSIMKRDHPQFDVVLTRETDIFIPLPQRAAVANRNNADFFLSIHANASPNRQARGIETYFLNWTDDEEAVRVAARENAISIKEMKKAQSDTELILASLDRDKKRDDSLKLAGYIHHSLITQMRPQYPAIHDLGVKSALFYVLVGAKMSSALAEVSFISNPDEERMLADEDYRMHLAHSLVAGIRAYFNQAPQQKVAAYRKAPRKSPAPKAKPVSYTRRTR